MANVLAQPVLLDDIVSTGHTLLAAGVTRVVSCDTVPHASNAIAMAPALAHGVRELAAAAAIPASFEPRAGNLNIIQP